MKCLWLWRPPHVPHWPSAVIPTRLAPQPLTFKARAKIGGARQSSGRGRPGSSGRAARTKPGEQQRPRRREARPLLEPAGEARARPPARARARAPGSAIRGEAYASHPAYGAPAAGEVRWPAPVKLL